MRKRMSVPAIAAALLALGLFVLAGCGDAITMTDVGELNDEEALREFIEDHGFFDETEIYGAESMVSGGTDSREEIDPLTFWREVTERHVVRDVYIDHEEGIAEVTIYKEIWGTLNIIDENMVEYEKPMHHEGVRYAVFHRNNDVSLGNNYGHHGETGNTHRHRRGRWTLTAISGLVANSVETLTMDIEWIHVQSATVDTTISDPSVLMAVPDEIMHFEMGEEVTVTVSGPPEDAILFLHTRGHRSPFQFEGGVFVGTWTVRHDGVHGAGVQALAHDSIYDSEYPDDSLIWGMPYEVGEEPEE
ncbi:MAG: hypothetical protein U9Q95_00620 [Candidatus Eisenbacteria bacterium]|nr:hypothetical protein [Candidatus Eisenbacteria bacterium]